MFSGAVNEMFLWKLNRQFKVAEFVGSLSFVVANLSFAVANSLLSKASVWFLQLGLSWSLCIPAPHQLLQHHRPLSAFHVPEIVNLQRDCVSSWLRVSQVLVHEQSALLSGSQWMRQDILLGACGGANNFSPRSWEAKKRGIESCSHSLLYYLTPEPRQS